MHVRGRPRLATMCSAIRLRIGDIFSTRSPAPDAPACLADAALEIEAAKAGLAVARRWRVGPAEAASVRGAAEADPPMNARMSSFVTRPAMPVP
jgi:hypothetical protein